MLCPLQSATSTMTSPSPAALRTPSTAAWAAPVRVTLNDSPTNVAAFYGLIPWTGSPHWRRSKGVDVFSVAVSVDSSPGPRYHIDAKVTRFGRMETPSYSILGRGQRTYKGRKNESFNTFTQVLHQVFRCLFLFFIFRLHFFSFSYKLQLNYLCTKLLKSLWLWCILYIKKNN